MLKFTYKTIINNSMQKIKQFIESDKGKDILSILVVILVGLGSFELGRLSKESSSSGIKIEYSNGEVRGESQQASVLSSVESNGSTVNKVTKPSVNAFFASNRGSKYYSLGCTGGKTIKQENRVYFNTSAQAEAAGYELSSSCD